MDLIDNIKLRIREHWPGATLFFLSLIVYIETLAPGVLLSDYGEFQYKLHTLDLIHPPGYPLYLILGKLWQILIPVGSIAYRVNLFSAFSAAVSVWLLCDFIHRLVGEWIPALVGAGIFAFSPLFWGYAITANTYPLNIVFFVLLLNFWGRMHDGDRSIVGLAFFSGLSLTHHRLIIVSIPWLIIFTLLFCRRELTSFQTGLFSLAVGVLPLGLYGILAWQGAWPLKALIRHVMIASGGQAIQYVSPLRPMLERLLTVVWPWLYQEYGLPVTLLGFIGLVTLFGPSDPTLRNRRLHLGLLLLTLLLTHLAFYSWVRIEPDEPRYFLPAYALLAVGVGVGLGRLKNLLESRFRGGGQVLLITLILPLSMLGRHWRTMDERHTLYFDHLTREALRAVEQDSTIIAGWSYAMPFKYYREVEGWRRDVQVLMPSQRVNRDRVIGWIERGKPIYFREGTFGLDWPDSGFIWVDMGVGGLYRAFPNRPPITHQVTVNDHPLIQGMGFSEWPLQPDELLRARMMLKPEGPNLLDAVINVQLADRHGEIWLERNIPLARLRLVEEGESRHVDLYFVVPPTAPPGDYTLQIELSKNAASLDTVSLSNIPLQIAERPIAPQRLPVGKQTMATCPSLEDTNIIASDWPGHTFSTNTLITLPVFWRIGESGFPHSIAFYLSDHRGSQPLSEPQSTFEDLGADRVPVGTLMESRHPIAFSTVSPGRYQVSAIVRTRAGVEHCDLGRVNVRARWRTYSAPPGLQGKSTTLGTEIELLGYELAPKFLRPGRKMRVDLYWRAKTYPSGNYKIFVHLVDAQGQLIEQSDHFPLEGRVMTSQLLPLEIITDSCIITIPEELARGVYQLEVGMYEPETGERLPALTENGERWQHNKIVLQRLPFLTRIEYR